MLDDEDTTITAGSIVTVSVRLVRKSMEELLGDESALLIEDYTVTELKPAVEDEPLEPLVEDQPEEQQEVRIQLRNNDNLRSDCL